MNSEFLLRRVVIGSLAAATYVCAPTAARACGGLFCSSPTLPVNQAAEKIIFSDNGDGTVTAVIEIEYQGPAQSFSWLLPIPSVPSPGQIGVASNLAFQRLQSATNPQYNLTVRVEGTCMQSTRGVAFSGATGNSTPTSVNIDSNTPSVVTVDASGTVGAFDWSVISVDSSVAEPSAPAIDWLTTNGYNVSPGAPGLIRPYLMDGMHLLALRLTKGSDVGSIRPLVLTYSAKSPMIPIKLTAVAANENMGVMTWLTSTARAVPKNYLALELNEARINWFNASSNYNAVVSDAANEAGGQGFVTEFAAPSSALANTVWTQADDATWKSVQSTVFKSFQELFDSSYSRWGQWDGFWDAMRASVTLPADVSFADFQTCPDCYASKLEFAPSALLAALESNVIQPMKDVQALLDRNPYVSRLYSTLSAEEMTTDPLFSFNPDLPDVSNLHSAVRVIECNELVTQADALWRIELPGGGVIRGKGSQATGTWPTALTDQPANQRIVRVAESGNGVVLEDNTQKIAQSLSSYNSKIAPSSDSGCSIGSARRPFSGWALAALAGLAWFSRRRRRG